MLFVEGFVPRSGDDAVPYHSSQWQRFRLIDLAAPALHAGEEVIHHAPVKDVLLVNGNIRCAHGNALVVVHAQGRRTNAKKRPMDSRSRSH